MSLRKLLGPVEIVTNLNYSEWDPRGLFTDFLPKNSMWIPDQGLCGWFVNSEISGTVRYGVAQYDGMTFTRNAWWETSGMIFPSKRNNYTIRSGNSIYKFDPEWGITGDFIINAILEQVVEWDTYNILFYAGNGGIYRTSKDNSNHNTDSVLLCTVPVSGSYQWFSFGEGDILWIGTDDGYLYEIDVRLGILKRTFRIPEIIANVIPGGQDYELAGAWFDNIHRIFVSYYRIGNETQIGERAVLYTWSEEVLPTGLSNPTISPGSVTSGHSNEVSVTLLGNLGEPCSGEIVAWEVTGPGSLVPMQSLTDSSGIAKTRYYAPVVSTGNITITATVISE